MKNNKYQEALDRISTNFGECEVGSRYYDLELHKDIATLQELANKETPIKVVKWELAKPETRCAKCGAGLERYHDYCWGCGQKLDWSDIDE